MSVHTNSSEGPNVEDLPMDPDSGTNLVDLLTPDATSQMDELGENVSATGKTIEDSSPIRSQDTVDEVSMAIGTRSVRDAGFEKFRKTFKPNANPANYIIENVSSMEESTEKLVIEDSSSSGSQQVSLRTKAGPRKRRPATIHQSSREEQVRNFIPAATPSYDVTFGEDPEVVE